MDLDEIGGCIGAQAEVDWAGARRSITGAGRHVVVLRSGFGDDFDPGTDAVAIALGSLQLQLEPMITARTLIDPDFRGRVDSADHNVEATVSI